MAGSLREDLLAIAGVAAADLDGNVQTPDGVRVRLAPGADADEVGLEVQRVLSQHGMRSHMTPGSDDSTEIVSQPHVSVSHTMGGGDVPPPPPGALRAAVGADVVQLPGLVMEPVPVVESAPGPGAPDALAAVAVEEARSGVTVRVSTMLGKQVDRSVPTTGPWSTSPSSRLSVAWCRVLRPRLLR